MTGSVTADVSALMRVLQERWVFTLATRPPDAAHAPYVTPLFYALAEPGALAPGPTLIFTSRPGTTHGRHLGDRPAEVAAAVYLETETVGLIRGVQARGQCVRASTLPEPTPARARAIYLARHPVAAPMLDDPERDHALYALAITWAKLTDNRLGFGEHPEWEFAYPWSELGQNGR